MTGHKFPPSCLECGREDVPNYLCGPCRLTPAYTPIVFAPEPDQIAASERAMVEMDALSEKHP